MVKVFDGILEDPGDIHNLLEVLIEKELTCAMQVNKGPLHEFVRILEINKDDRRITWQLLKDGTSLKKKSEISDITTIRVNTNDDLMIMLKPEPTRWNTLDASDV